MTQVLVNGITIEYECHGDSADPCFVLVRGLGTQLIDWPPSFISGLVEAGFSVLTFDNRDVGLSQKLMGEPDLRAIVGGQAPPYRLDDMANDIVGVMDELGIAQAHLFGISMGGMIGQVMAVHSGHRLLSFCSVMSSSSRPGLPGPTPAAAASLAQDVGDTADEQTIVEATVQGLEVCGSPAYPLSSAARMRIARARFRRNYCPAGVKRQMAAIVASGDRSELLRTIKVPTLVIHGNDDPLIPVAAGKDTARLIPGARLVVIAGMGHDLPESLVPEMLTIVTEFAEQVTAAAVAKTPQPAAQGNQR